ncbi:MAG: hypothetical protein JNM17_34075 [Archangium sp.]|nr:hypothetical protein [Archangium sp.]
MAKRFSAAVCVVVLAGCGAKGPLPEKPEINVGRCVYTNGFSRKPECREYRGAKWTEAAATADCRDQNKSFEPGATCAEFTDTLGECVLGQADQYTWITMIGNDAAACASTKRGCEFFGGGTFGPSSLCSGVDPDTSTGVGLPVFQWPERVCKDPMPGEAPGKSNGQVCTWEMISGATEEGRAFENYASCDRVRTQRPYYPVPANVDAEKEDARLADPAYAAELSWVKAQINSTACVCCHSTRAPQGPSNWYVDQRGNFLNGFFNRGLAMGAGWIDTASFGTYPSSENNGFHRASPEAPAESIFVTTDQARMKRFFEAELAHRGVKREDFPPQSYGAGPLDIQRQYVAEACNNGEGISADGVLTWRLGAARYVYVMEATSAPPGVPPNLDLPPGVLWRFDVPWTGTAVASGTVKYGVAPEGTLQRAPLMGPAPALESGKQYYLYVMADIAQPNTRCLFTAP